MSFPGKEPHTLKEGREKSDESYDPGYASIPDLEVAWYPENPHQARIKPYQRADTSSSDLPPLARVMTFPIVDGDPFIKVWEEIRLEVHDILKQENLDWTSLGIFRRRQTYDPMGFDTTLVITARRSKWGSSYKNALRRCHNLTEHGPQRLKLWVELRDERPVFDTSDHGSSSTSKAPAAECHKHFRKPGLGLSIGVKDVYWSSGTIGGFVEMENTSGESDPIICALTNHRVARPTKIVGNETGPGPVNYDPRLDETEKYHEAVIPGSGLRLLMCQPSLKDHERMIQMLEERIVDAKRSSARLEIRASGGNKLAQQRLLQNKEELRDLEKEHERVSEFDLEYGMLWASSGYAKSPRTGGSLDWALVHVRKDRIGQNTPRRRVLNPSRSSRERAKIARTSISNQDTQVVQIGKRSKATFGRVNRIRSDLQLEELSDEKCREIMIVGDKGVEFSQEGDSGAWVFSQYGDFLGMVYGASLTGDCGAFVTPIDEIGASVLEMTGHRMRILDELLTTHIIHLIEAAEENGKQWSNDKESLWILRDRFNIDI
ncbi:MAG: hypothetical protein M1812_003101 [Candelaria pacifica]|nr:MAG: hypothetical protein M1812_003101 [Candelaria pacifica]